MTKESKSGLVKAKRKKIHLFSPRYLYYGLYAPTCLLFKILFRVKVKGRKEFKNDNEAKLILCTHNSPFDFIFIGWGLSNRRVAFVAAEQMLYRKAQGFIIRRTHSITKKQFVPDVACIKSIKRHIEQGVSVVLYPEGKISTAGTTNYLVPSLGKLIRLLKVPVSVCNVSGSYLTKPLWASSMRFGKVNVNLSNIITKEESITLKPTELYDRVKKAMYYNDWEYQIDNNIKFLGSKYAEGLENILYYCPHCKSEYNMTTNKNLIKCNSCNKEYILARDGLIKAVEGITEIDRVDKWYEYQRELLKIAIEDENYCLESEVNVYYVEPKTKEFVFGDSGNVSYNKEGLIYKGMKGETFFPAKNIPTMTLKPGGYFTLYAEGNTLRFEPSKRQLITKFNLLAETIHAKYYS